MQAVGVCKGQPCLLVSRVLYRYAHSTKLRTSLLYRTASSGIRLDKLTLQPRYGLLQVSSSIEDAQENDAGTMVVKVKFILERRCEFGQQFSIIGDDELFGAWDPEAAIPMQWSEGHIWTTELDLSVGRCVEFKVILMAEQEVLEWQPGPNRKVEVSGDTSSIVVLVPWSDEEDNIKMDAQVDVKRNEFLTQDGKEAASSVEKSPDLAENIASETHSVKSEDVAEEQLIEERSTNSGMINANAKGLMDEQQTETKSLATGNELIDARMSLDSELKSTSPFAIPESWYGEEMSGVSSSHDSMESAPASTEDAAKGETMSAAFKSTSNDMEEENKEKLMLLHNPDEVICEGKASFATLPVEFAPIMNDEQCEELGMFDMPVEVDSQRNVGTLLPDAELKDINEESSEKHIVHNGPVQVIAEINSETNISTTASNNPDHIDKEVMVDNESPIVTDEVTEVEHPSMATNSLENVETEPSVTAKEKGWVHKGWSKLWGVLVHGRMPQ